MLNPDYRDMLSAFADAEVDDLVLCDESYSADPFVEAASVNAGREAIRRPELEESTLTRKIALANCRRTYAPLH